MSQSNTSSLHYAVSKVPEATVIFWIIKILTTGMGETMSDFLTNKLNPVIAVVGAFVALILILRYQLSRKKYIPWIYWLTVIMVSIFGTMAADSLHVLLGIPYLITTSFYILILAGIFFAWQRSEKTLSIHSITTRRREMFYWAVVLATFALGTATGDMIALTLHWGFLYSGLLCAFLILIPTIGHWKFHFNPIFAFWFAYVLTRPLGASFADWMGVPAERSGLGWGTGPVSLVLLILIIGFVVYVSITHEDVERHELKDPVRP